MRRRRLLSSPSTSAMAGTSAIPSRLLRRRGCSTSCSEWRRSSSSATSRERRTGPAMWASTASSARYTSARTPRRPASSRARKCFTCAAPFASLAPRTSARRATRRWRPMQEGTATKGSPRSNMGTGGTDRCSCTTRAWTTAAASLLESTACTSTTSTTARSAGWSATPWSMGATKASRCMGLTTL